MKRIEVRCCCQPQKLLGTLPVPDLTKLGDRVGFVMMKPSTRSIEAIQASAKRMSAPSKVELPIESFADMTGSHPKYSIAVKAEGMTVAQLRLIPGFIEATP